MTKARDIADFKFEDIVDTGTEGTKVALGTTAQRGSTTGQFRFNSTTGLAEYYTGTAFKSIDAPPTISSVANTNITDTQISANFDLGITGSGFNSGATIKFIGNDGTEYASPTVTVNSETSITARVPTSVTNANEPFDVKVSNVSGLSNTLADAFNVNAKPAWQTASGTIATVNESSTLSNVSISASDPEGQTISYTETGGSVLSTNSLTLNSSTGAITGTAPTVSSDTTLTFTGRASDGTNITDRSFNIIIKDIATGGNNIYTYTYGGTSYKLHKFTSNGNFITGNRTVDYLIIGAGGGGGHHSGGGGGAGGLVWLTGQSLSAGTFPVVIGNGGSTSYNTNGTDGQNSTFNGKTSLGGGGGSGEDGTSGRNGGSGGGGGRTNQSAGSSTQNSTYGYGIGFGGSSSGANNGDPNYAGYAGGGAGGAGSNRIGGIGSSTFVGDTASTTAFLLNALAGTDSSNSATTGSSSGTLYIAGGGGGSDQQNATNTDLYGGAGGGAAGSDSSGFGGISAIANTGSGGGGQGWNSGNVQSSGTGATGIVIVRYTI